MFCDHINKKTLFSDKMENVVLYFFFQNPVGRDALWGCKCALFSTGFFFWGGGEGISFWVNIKLPGITLGQ